MSYLSTHKAQFRLYRLLTVMLTALVALVAHSQSTLAQPNPPYDSPPNAVALSANTDEDTPVTIQTPVGYDSVYIVVRQNAASGPAHGTVVEGPVIGGNYTINYTPGQDRTDTVTFSYAFCQGSNVQNCGTSAPVQVTIRPTNDAPTANPDGTPTPIQVQEDSALVIDVLANDSTAPDTGDALSVSAVVSPTTAGGTTEIVGNRVLYTPLADYCGPDDFDYTAKDSGGLTDVATVSIMVICVNDPPIAVDDEHSTGEDFPVNMNVIGGTDLTNGGALDVVGLDSTGPANESAQSLTIVAVSAPAHGTATIDTVNNSIIYTPSLFYNGLDLFTYTVEDDGIPPLRNTATVTMTVDPLPNQPLLTIDGPHNVGNHRFTIDVVLTSPDQNVSSLDYRLRYGDSGCLLDPDSPVNGLANNVTNMPNAGEGFYSQVEDEFIFGALLHFISAAQPPANANDPLDILAGPDGPTVERVVATVAFLVDPACVDANGNANISLIFGNQREFGDELSQPIPGGQMINALLTVPANAAPTDIRLNPATVVEGVAGASAGLLSTTDADSSDTHTYAIGGAGADNGLFRILNGRELLLNSGVSADFETKSSYEVSIVSTDPYGGTFTKLFTITVVNGNEAPTAVDDGALFSRIPVVGPTDIDVLANDFDPDGSGSLSVKSATNGTHGIVVNNGSDVTFIPTNPLYRGPDSFTYTLQDNGGITDDAQVFVTIQADRIPGDCNGDGFVRASDMTALGNELFDGDDNSKWYLAGGGSFAGSPYGCNANANSSIDAGDFICIANFIFNRPCNPIVAANSNAVAILAVGSDLAGEPGSTISIPILLSGNGQAISAAAFAVNFDSSTFDYTDAVVHVSGDLLTDVYYNADESRVEIIMAGMTPPFQHFGDGTLATVNLTVKEAAFAGDSAVTLSNSSLGGDDGRDIPLEVTDGAVTIDGTPGGTVLDLEIFIPLISR